MSNVLYGFQTVKREKCKASIVIEGLSGKGKSGLALTLAYALASAPDKIFAVDTENQSLRLFEGIPASFGDKFSDFQVADFTPDLEYKPSHYQNFKQAALEHDAEVVIFDSISHAWQYKGGILDMVSELKKTNTRYQKDGYAAWGDESIVKEKNMLLEMLRDYRCHMISTVRVKEKMEYGTDEKGKNTLISLGEQQIMQGDMKYEPDLVLHMVEPGSGRPNGLKHPQAKITKSRYAIFEEGDIVTFTPQICKQLRDYLNEGTSPDELLEAQRQEYVQGVNEHLKAHPNAVPIWEVLKEKHGYKKEDKANDIPLADLKKLYIEMTID